MTMMRRFFPCAILGLALHAGGCQPAPPPAVARPLLVEFEQRPWDGDRAAGRELLTDHYRIYTTVTRPEVLQYLPGFLEAAHANYRALTGLGPAPPARRMPVYMMGSRAEWAALTRSVVGSQWGVYSSIEAGGYCHRGVGVFWDIGGISSMSIAAHEGLHQFLYHRLADRLPMWAEEGLAASAEGYQLDGLTVRFTPGRNPARFSDLRRGLVNDWWIPLEKLLAMDAGDALQGARTERAVVYYGQLWALVHLLRSDPAYADGFARLLADAEAGSLHQALRVPADRLKQLRRHGRRYNRTVSASLFRHYVTDDLDGFERQYRAFARTLARLG